MDVNSSENMPDGDQATISQGVTKISFNFTKKIQSKVVQGGGERIQREEIVASEEISHLENGLING
jgi:ribosomal protein L18E